jgi:putative hydrolase of the HAD superfamily
MPLLGYGTKAFTLSMIETALRVSRHEMDGRQLSELQQLCYTLLELPATPLPEVSSTLQGLHDNGQLMAVFTKGELLDQENKLKRSGLESYFSHMETVSNKTEKEYRQLCENLGVAPEQTVMVGNSFRSDIAPALTAGAYAIHIPYHVVWELEKSEEYPHERLRKIAHFGEIADLL